MRASPLETTEEEEGLNLAHAFRGFGAWLLGHLPFKGQSLAIGEYDRAFHFVADKKQTERDREG